jgi:HEAT repeat protein
VRRGSLAMLVALIVGLAAPGPARAEDARLAFLGRMLKGSGEYRVRVQAALSLGEIGGHGASAALIEALRDDHPAVRTAAAAALGRLGDAAAVEPLEGLDHDSNAGVRSAARRSLRALRAAAQAPPPHEEGTPPPEPAAPQGPAHFYVGVGDMGSRAGTRDAEVKSLLKRYVREALGRANGVRIAPDGESPQTSGRVIDRGHLEGYFLTGSCLKLQAAGAGNVHAEVSVMVLTNPGRDLRFMLNGAADATSRGANDVDAQNSALAGAAEAAVGGFARHIGAPMR